MLREFSLPLSFVFLPDMKYRRTKQTKKKKAGVELTIDDHAVTAREALERTQRLQEAEALSSESSSDSDGDA